MSSSPKVITASHIIARLATFILAFKSCMQKYIIKMTISKSLIWMYFTHPFWCLLVFLWTVGFRRLRESCCQFIYLSLNGTLTLMEVFLEVTPRYPCLQQSQLNSECSGDAPGYEIALGSWPMTGDDSWSWSQARQEHKYFWHIPCPVWGLETFVKIVWESILWWPWCYNSPAAQISQQSKRDSVLLKPNLNLLKLILGL